MKSLDLTSRWSGASKKTEKYQLRFLVQSGPLKSELGLPIIKHQVQTLCIFIFNVTHSHFTENHFIAMHLVSQLSERTQINHSGPILNISYHWTAYM